MPTGLVGSRPNRKQGLGQRSVRISGEVGCRSERIPVVTEQIRSEVGHRVLVDGAVQNLQDAQIDSGRGDLAGLQQDPDFMGRNAAAINPPLAVHLQVRVEARRPDPDEEMLAPAEHLVDRVAGEVDGGEARDADVAAGEGLSGQCIAQDGGGVEDGVALGHGFRLRVKGGAGLGGFGQRTEQLYK